MIHPQLVFTNRFTIIESQSIETDIFDQDADISAPFTIPLDEGQEFTAGKLFISVDRIGGFLKGFITIFLNGIVIGRAEWPSARTEPIVFDIDIPAFIRLDGRENVLKVGVKSQIDGKNQWIIFSQITYNLNTEEAPSQEPMLGPVIIDDSTPGGPGETEPEKNFITELLFGDINKTIRTVAIVGVAVGGLVLLTQVTSLARTLRPVRSRAAL